MSAVNLEVALAAETYGPSLIVRAHERATALGFILVHAERAGDRLCAWIDLHFAPSWWSTEARAGSVWYAVDRSGDVAGFASYDVRGFDFPWLRGRARQPGVGIFGPFGVRCDARKTGIGAALLDAALASLAGRGFAHALVPAVGYAPLVALYERLAGAQVVERPAYDPPRRYRATILASGSGTNAQAVFDAVALETLALDLAGLVANKADAGALARARQAGIPATSVVWNRPRESRAHFDARVDEAVAATQPDLVLLLGWMHRLPASFIERFPEVLNVHPAFLPFDPAADDVVCPDGTRMPAFRGAHAVRDALAAGAAWTGATVHRVTAEVDRGAVVVRTPLRVMPGESVGEVALRLRPLEHAAVLKAIRRWTFER